MKLEAIQKAILTARERASLFEGKAKQLAQAARSAKDRAKLAKGKLKLAKQEAKKARKASKEAKRKYAEALSAAEIVASDLALLESKIKRARGTAQRVQTNAERRARSDAPYHKTSTPAAELKPTRPKAPPRLTKAMVAKPAPRPVAPAKPVEVAGAAKRTPAPITGRELGVQVPRELESSPSVTPPSALPQTDISKSPGANTVN